MKVAILCGGQGTRLSEETVSKPKPMVEIGGHPILWHICRMYSAFGLNEFVLALGHKGGVIKEYFLNFFPLNNDVTIRLKDGRTTVHPGELPDWTIHMIDTGPETQTGGRVKRLAPCLSEGTFMLTYGDGVADIDIARLLEFHRSHGRLATVTAVRPPARFGSIRTEGDRVVEFVEKPQAGEGWVNGGFFVLEPKVLDYIGGDATIWEREPLERLAADGQLALYRHDGFWQCMDTLRDVRLLNELWESGNAPWARRPAP